MTSRVPAAALAWLCVLAGARASQAADDATLLRVFLRDGTSLTSYGEFARVADRVVFSIPTASTANPPLQIVNLSADRVDWDRTNRYAESARAARYVATQGENDYVAVSNSVSRALNEATFTQDPLKRLAIVESARQTLAEWPQNHFNYRSADVRQMLSMLDEAIADIRATAGASRFDLTLVTVGEPPPPSEPLLPPPSPIESIDELLVAANLSDLPEDRRALLDAALGRLERDKAALPSAYVAATRTRTRTLLDEDARVARSYQRVIRRSMSQAAARARVADVNGIRKVLESLRRADAALGGKRTDAVAMAIAGVEAQLDLARRLRLARDRWAMRAPTLKKYGTAMADPLGLFRGVQEPLDDIKELAGSTQAALAYVQRQVQRALKAIEAIAPPEEGRAAHALLVSAAYLAENAAKIRREATLNGDIARAWDASSSAAGALMLSAKARTEILSLLRPPELQ